MVSSSSGSNNSCEEPRTIHTLSRKHKLTTHNRSSEQLSGISNAVRESLSSCRRARLPEMHRRSNSKKIPSESSCCMNGNNTCNATPSNDNEEAAAADEKAEVEKKILALQRIVPGGESLGVDKLFEETAGYILALQFQVKALRALTSFAEGSEKEKRKLGG